MIMFVIIRKCVFVEVLECGWSYIFMFYGFVYGVLRFLVGFIFMEEIV